LHNDVSGNLTQITKVPLTYSPKDKMLARVIEDANIDRPVSLQLPMMSFEMNKFDYDGNRKLGNIGKVTAVNPLNKNSINYIYNPVPYNIGFSLHIYTKTSEDGTKIVEQILPFFTPDFTVTVALIPELNIVVDVPIILNGVEFDDRYDGDFKDRQSIIWTLNFTLKGYLYGPSKSSSIIKFANTDFYIPNVPDGYLINAVGNTKPSVLIQNTPGLTANGQPTSNVSLSISPLNILATDSFGYVTVITEK
jgi:hypothetical protein